MINNETLVGMTIVYPTLRGRDVCALLPELTELNLANWISRGHVAIQSEPPPAGSGTPRIFSLLEFAQIVVMAQLVEDLHLGPAAAAAASLPISGHVTTIYANALRGDTAELEVLTDSGSVVVQDGVVTLFMAVPPSFDARTAVVLEVAPIFERINEASGIAIARLSPSLERAGTGNQGFVSAC